jgi:hypothetical protein
MTFITRLLSTPRRALDSLRSGFRSPIRPTRIRHRLAGGAAVGALSLVALAAFAPPPPPSAAEELKAYINAHSQSLKVSEDATVVDVLRDKYVATPGVESLVISGTNYDWARLVMMDGGWPQSDANVTVMVRWMRQENGADNWWNRNNPMNNGYGSGGGGGTGSYSDLVMAAQMAAENLKHNPGFASIVAGFANGTSSATTEQAIWASPWASGHYGNGSRWHYTPVDVVKAPTSAW